MPNRPFSLLAATFLILFGNNSICSPKARLDIPSMATFTTSKVPVEVKTFYTTNTASPLGSTILHIELTNHSPYPISVLKWLTPLDLKATAIGVFTITSMTSKTIAWRLNLKVNRQPPELGYLLPHDDAIIEIPGNGKAKRDVEVKEPEVALIKGEIYTAKAKGHWMTVWIHEKERSENERLHLDAENLRSGDFESNETLVEISENLGDEI